MQPDDPGYYTGPPEMRGHPLPPPMAQPPAPPPWPGYPAPGYPPGYPVVDPYLPGGTPRPGTAIAAAVLGLVNSGLLVLAAFLAFLGAALVGALADFDGSGDARTIEHLVTLLGVVNLVCAGLLISGSVLLLNRRPVGRQLCLVGHVLVLAAGIAWLSLSGHLRLNTPVAWFVMFVGLAAVAVGLTYSTAARRWIDTAT